MKRYLLYFSMLLMAVKLPAQTDLPPVISGSYQGIAFSAFAADLKARYEIVIFYNPEWVKDVIINAKGDSISVINLLSETLSPAGIKIFYKGNLQFFLTGTTTISDNALRALAMAKAKAKEDINPDKTSNFAVNRYDKKINRVIVGTPGNRETTGTAVLKGRITSTASAEPVIGATVFITGTNKGVITDSEGKYTLQLDVGNTYTLQISCMGMEKESYIVEVNGSGTVNIEMTDQLMTLQEVVVRSGKHDNVGGIQMGFQRIEMKDIKNIPAVMGERDILKVAKMMPGVQTVGEGSAGFNVRGSSSDQNLFLLNKIPIFNTGHLFGFFSAFNPDMVSDFNFYKSAFPAEYGGRLASIFEISTRKGNKKKFGARGALSPVTGSLMVETPIVKDKGSLIVGARSTYSDWILKMIDDPAIKSSKAAFNDMMASFHFLPDSKSSLQIFGYYSFDRFKLSTTNIYRYENIGSSILYDRKLNPKWDMNAALVYSQYSNYHAFTEEPAKAYDNLFTVSQKEIKLKFTGYQFNRHKTGIGADVVLYNVNQGEFKPYTSESLIIPNVIGREKGLENSLFLDDEFSVTERLKFYGGLRYSFFNYLGPKDIYVYEDVLPMTTNNIIDTLSYGKNKNIASYSGPEFRASLNWEIMSDFSMKLGYNRMRQYLFMLSNTVAMSPTDRWKLTDPYVTPPVADQISFGLYKNFNKAALETSAEVYLKKTHNIVEYKDGSDISSESNFETLILQGKQDSWGAEFLVKKNAGRFTGWMSYTYTRSLITVTGDYSWDRINNGVSYPANYDIPHSFNFVSNYSLSRRMSFSTNLVYSKGRPITYPTGIFKVNGMQGVSYSYRNEFRIPDYFRIDLSVNIEGNLIKSKVAHGSWMISIYNLTGRKNAYSVYFKNEKGILNGYKQSIYGVPIFTVSYNFKLGNYASE